MVDERRERPDPDELLERVQREESERKRGRLKIFFGFAPGVGKTYRMLEAARRAKDAGRDVRIGLVETHRRADTEAMRRGLGDLGRRLVEYRGQKLEEFDLPRAIAEAPSLLLVDELAHTNAPGTEHPKRWQDVLDLVDRGIDVWTTLNVQHVESLNDVVGQITGVRVRETVPDSVLDRADEIELVDLPPEQLLVRLGEGKVYGVDQAARAVQHFFQLGNLHALRELALRRTAEHVDEDVIAYRRDHGVRAPWPSSERLLVGVGAAPTSAKLIRATARMAASLHGTWFAVYVEDGTRPPLRTTDRERLEAHLALAESLGGVVVRAHGRSPADVLLEQARHHNVTRIVLGKPRHHWLRDRLVPSILDHVVRGSGDIDVLVIRGDDRESLTAVPTNDIVPSSPPDIAAYALATLAVAAMTGVAAVLQRTWAVPDVEVLYLVAVLGSAMALGRGPSMWAALLGVGAYDFFFVEPRYTFAVADVRYLLTFLMLFGVGVVVSELTTRLRREERAASTREQRTSALYALTRELAAAERRGQLAEITVRHVVEGLRGAAHVLSVTDGRWSVLASRAGDAARTGEGTKTGEGAAFSLDAKRTEVARWSYEHRRPAGLGTDTLPGTSILCTPIASTDVVFAVLAIEPGDGRPLGSEQRAFIETLVRQVAIAHERIELADRASAALVRAQAEELRSSLLATVSHDLRTPLAAITGAAAALGEEDALDGATRAELLAGISEDAERLERLVTNLLDMTRIAAGVVEVKREWVPLEEIVGSALHRLERWLEGRPVEIAITPALLLVSVDPVLFEQVVWNLVENAVKHTPPGTAIAVRASEVGGEIQIDIADEGPGIAPEDVERVFETFQRGRDVRSVGSGLGLAICRGIVRAHGGTLRYVRGAGRELSTFRITLPTPREAPPSMAALSGGDEA